MASLNCFLHPHHITLMDHPHTFHSFRQHLEDPYYAHELSNGNSHRGLVAPKFDVYGNQKAYFLSGELPGVSNKKEIRIEWLADQTLVVRGWMKHVQIEAGWETDTNMPLPPTETATKNGTAECLENGTDSVASESKTWLRERQQGEFERSFTFPTNVLHEGVRAKLEDGILKIMVLRGPTPNAEEAKAITVE